MILLRLISWQYVRKHKFRWFLTIMGIAIGIAVLVGMHTANQSVLFAFQRTIDRIAGTTQLQVTAGEAGFPEEALEKVQSLGEIRAAAPVIEAPVNTGFRAQGNILILGVDMTGDRNVRDYDLEESPDGGIDDPLVFLAQPDSIIITRTFAGQTGLAMNSRVPMQTMVGERQFTVRGIMKSGGLASAFGGNLAIMDIYSAQKVFGRGRRFDRIDIMVKDGVAVETAQAKLRIALGAGYLVDKPSSRGQQFESTAQIYSLVSSVTSLFALFIGMFIIYNTFEIAVTQRRSEIGILRALGAAQRQIRVLFLVESAVAGLLGSAVGILAGLGVAQLIAASISNTLGEVYGVAQRAGEIAADPKLLIVALVAGTVTSIIAAIVPAWDAAKVDPVKALQKGHQQMISAHENRMRRNSALICMALSLICMYFSRIRELFYAGYLIAVLAAVLIVPAAAGLLARLLRPVMKALLPVEGTLAADSLIEAPRRTAGTVTALMLSLALVVALAGSARSSYEAIRQWLSVALNPDLFVTTSESLTTRSFVFPAEIGDLLKPIPGVDTIQRVRSVKIVIRDTPVMLVAADFESILTHAHLPVIAGDESTMWQAAAKGKGVIASDNFAILRKYRLGDTVELPSPDGLLKLPIVGIVTDYSDQQGSILMDRQVYVSHWHDDGVNIFRLYLTKGATDVEVRKRIQEAVGARTRLFVFTNQDLRRYVLRLTDQWFSITYVQIFVAMLVAVLGIVNTLTVSISDRKRELGVLQAVGGLRNQIRRTIWMEAFVIGLIGLILGLIVGAIQLFFIVEMTRTDIAGIRLEYVYPVSVALSLIPGILIVAYLAAIGPAEAAVRGSLVEALEYE
jgi:putative ABC transport system permease protein